MSGFQWNMFSIHCYERKASDSQQCLEDICLLYYNKVNSDR